MFSGYVYGKVAHFAVDTEIRYLNLMYLTLPFFYFPSKNLLDLLIGFKYPTYNGGVLSFGQVL